MKRVAALVFAATCLPGCVFSNGNEPAPPADASPRGAYLGVFGVALFDGPTLNLTIPSPSSPAIYPTAVGGQQTLELAVVDPKAAPGALPAVYAGAYTATVSPDVAGGVTIASTAPQIVTVTGASAGSNTLTIVGDNQTAHATVDAEVAETVSIASSAGEEYTHGAPLAFVPENVAIGIQLERTLDAPITQRLVDTSLTATGLAGATHVAWDNLHAPALALGAYNLVVTAAGVAPQTFPITIVAGPDRVTPRAMVDVNIAGGGTAKICFDAYAQTTLVAGLVWSFEVAEPATRNSYVVAENCLAVTTNGSTVTGNVTAGALTTPFSVAIPSD